MAPSLTTRPSPLPSPRLSVPKSHRPLLGVRCGSGSPGSGDDGAPPVVRAAVSAVTELLRAFSPKKPSPAVEAVDAESESPRSVDDVVAVLEADYRRAYFLTGNFTLGIYAEDCLFEDPTIKFRGRSRYSQNLDLLVPFFDSPSLQLENIDKPALFGCSLQLLKTCMQGLRVDTKFIIASWTLRTYLRLPWRPLIAIRGNTTYDLDEEYKVVRHAESWDVSALEAIGQLFVSAPKQKGS
ncbi:uncharacterized protein LOC123443893 isoform X3 [Hordeum vulgare subsp. vulgare]|uniref:uncharacterized protein LOC123443893 isoform X3 n=1 Tax=Hordeum vulgare subsp. vulgare TaxID=112509 RepID=UPI001D1A3EB4|nr:uncharacterized protein LOC123443893 isoform X3 [Hordeum vulgare subsp. vulgare]